MTHRRAQLLFHLGIPLGIGAIFGFNQVRLGEHMTLGVSIVFWLLCSFGAFFIFEMVTLVAARFMKPWSPSFGAVLLVGMVAASLPARAYLYALAAAFQPLLLDGVHPRVAPPLELTTGFLISHVTSWAGFFIFWLAVNVSAVRLLGISRFGFAGRMIERSPAPAPAASPTSDPAALALPRFLARIPGHLGTDVIGLSSQDHYLQVHTRRGNALILYNLGEAIAELERSGVEGVRVHRSHWVASAGVAEVVRKGRNCVVRLSTGVEFPVSQTYRELLRQGDGASRVQQLA